MLDGKITLVPNAIEAYFCEPFERLQQHPMTEDNTKFFMSLLMSKDDEVRNEIPKIVNFWSFKAMEKRLEVCHKYTLDNRSKIFIFVLTDGTIGQMVMYITYLQYVAKKRNWRSISIEQLADIFPMGFPSKEDLSKLWDSQKVENVGGSDNLLDYERAIQSILFTEETEKA